MKKVKKGVIAAAGWGTRFLPVVKAYPKELVPILNKPNIQYLIEELLGAGVNEIAIVHRPGQLKIKKYFSSDRVFTQSLRKIGKENLIKSLSLIQKKAKLYFLPQPSHLPYGNASPVLTAQSFVGKEAFVFMFGDDLILEKQPGNYLKHLIKIFQKYQPALVLGAQKVPPQEVKHYASIRYLQDDHYPHRAIEVLEKLPSSQAPSNFVQFGRFVVSPQIFPVLQKQKPSRNHELWFADAVNTLAQKTVVIAEPIQNGCWFTTGDPLRWLKANLAFGLKNKKIKKELKKFLQQLL